MPRLLSPLIRLRDVWRLLLPSILSFLFISHAQSAAIGLPASTIQIGLGTNINLMRVNDTQGNTNQDFSAQPASFFITDWFVGGTRYLGELYVSKYVFNADSSNLGEQVEDKGARFSVQMNVKHNKYLSPWYGAGIDLSHARYSRRHRVDEDGYLSAQYEDISQFGMNLLINAMESWTITKELDIGAKLEYRLPLTQTVNGFAASVLMIFRPDL